MKKVLLIFIVVILYCNIISAQSPKSPIITISVPEKNNFSTERLQKIDQLIQQYIDSNWIANAITLIAKNGNIVYYKALGYDDKEKNKLLQRDAIFRIASQAKAITSVAVMMLYEEGKFLLDDPISKYIPEFKNPTVIDKFNKTDTSYTTIPAKREITIRDLLTHTSGIGYAQIGNDMMNAIYYKTGVGNGIGIKTIKDNIKRLGKVPLFHQPGEKWTYGLNFDVLGYLVEVTGGMSLNSFFQKRIFEPLGMKDSYFLLPKEKYNRLTMLYTEDNTKHVVKMNKYIQLNGIFYRDYPKINNSFFSGGGGLVSTAYDYAIFLQMLLNKGEYNGKQLLKSSTVDMMTQNQIGDLNDSRSNKFGLGFELVTKTDTKPNLSEGSFLWGGMFGSLYWVDPKEKMVVQFILQKYPNSYYNIFEKFKALVYQALQ